MSERKQQGNKYIQTYRRPGQLIFVDTGGVIAVLPCADGVPEEINTKYAQAVAKAIEDYGRCIGVYA